MARIIPLLVLLVAPALAQAETFKIATLAPEGSGWMNQIRSGAEQLGEATEGRIKLKFYPGGVMGNETTVLRKIKVGQLQGGAFTAKGLVDVYNDVQVYGIPFMFRTYEEVEYVRERVDARIRNGLEQHGLVMVGFAGGGFAYLLSKDPVHSRDDLKGHKVWVPEGDIMSQIAFETAGISPVPLPIADVFTGLQTGLIDTVAISPVGAIALQWHTKVKYMVDVPLVYLVGMLAVDKRRFDKLSAADQTAFREIMGEAFAAIDATSRSDNESAKKALLNQGIQVFSPTEVELARWQELAAEARKQYEGKNLYSPEAYGLIQQSLAEYR